MTVPPALIENFAEDVDLLWTPRSVTILDEPPSPLSFLRDYVSKSKPCIIRNTMGGLTMTLDELESLDDDDDHDHELQMTVDVTPDGHGDNVRTVLDNDSTQRRRVFVKPKECEMSLSEFISKLRSSEPLSTAVDQLDVDGRNIFRMDDGGVPGATASRPSAAVYYYSRQNDCLRTELKPLFNRHSFPDSFGWAEEAFGTGPPDAVNLWIGNEKAVSSMHKDHYENLFYVLSGEKIFTLCPPSDAPFLSLGDFESGTFETDENGDWFVSRDDETNDKVKWIEADVTQQQQRQSTDRFPLLGHTHPLTVRVQAGEMLYLPALWYHRVTQSCETVGINYWYDMHFDGPHWCYFNLLQQMNVQMPRDEVGPEEVSRQKP